MEKNLQDILNDVISVPKTTGALVINNQGLCISNLGKISPSSSGIMLAILEQASKLQPNSNPPMMSLEYGNRKCLINKHGEFTCVLYTDESLGKQPGQPSAVPANGSGGGSGGGGGGGGSGGIPAPTTTKPTGTVKGTSSTLVSDMMADYI